jgi:regulatory protein
MAGKITALNAQKRNHRRINVHIDGQFAFGLAAVVATRLQIGQYLTDRDIEELETADSLQVAYDRALHFLSFRPRSLKEVRQSLSKKGFSEMTVEATLQRLEESDLVNDLEFARYWVEQREQFRPRGTAMLQYELRQKGVAPEAIALSLEEIDEETLAYRAAHRQAERLRTLPPKEFGRKLGSYLSRRGFPYPIVRETIAQLRQELCPDQNDENNI